MSTSSRTSCGIDKPIRTLRYGVRCASSHHRRMEPRERQIDQTSSTRLRNGQSFRKLRGKTGKSLPRKNIASLLTSTNSSASSFAPALSSTAPRPTAVSKTARPYISTVTARANQKSRKSIYPFSKTSEKRREGKERCRWR